MLIISKNKNTARSLFQINWKRSRETGEREIEKENKKERDRERERMRDRKREKREIIRDKER